MAEEKSKLPPGMIAPTMAARITHFWHNMRMEGIQEREIKRAEETKDIPFIPNRKQRRAAKRRKK